MHRSKVSEFIENKFQGHDIEVLGGGHHSQAYKFETEDNTLVLRISPKKDHFLRDKFIADRWPDLLVPKVVETSRFEGGGYYAVSEYVEGNVLASGWEFNPELNPKDVKDSFVEALVNIAKTDVSSTSGYGKILDDGRGEFDSWQDFLMAVFESGTGANIKIKRQVEEGLYDSKLLEQAEAATRKLLADTSTYETKHLLHGDFQPHNVIVKEKDVVAVLDWGNAKYGDFAYDIMWCVMHGPEVASLKEIKSTYKRSGLDTTEIHTRLKLAEISILISWAMFSNEIGNYDNAKSDQARLNDLLAS